MRNQKRIRYGNQDRRGIAAVELAFCVPVLVIVTLGYIDLTNLIYFRQNIRVACYDAAKTAASPTSTESDVQAAAASMMDLRGIEGWTLELPEDFSSIGRGTVFEISLTVPITEISHFSGLGIWSAGPDSNFTVVLSVMKE